MSSPTLLHRDRTNKSRERGGGALVIDDEKQSEPETSNELS
jgi:hypothetical protein